MGNPQQGGGSFTLPGEGGAEVFTFEDFGSLNTKANRPAIDDKEFSWNENWLPIGAGNLRTTYAEGPILYSAPKSIIYKYPFNFDDQSYIAVFFDDGTAVQVSNPGGVVTPISSTSGTFYDPTSSTDLPQAVQWQAKYLLIVGSNRSAPNGSYNIWDGTSLYGAGSLAPDVNLTAAGHGYTSKPTITAVGGTGSGATFDSTLDPASGTIDKVTVTNPGTGYSANDTVQLSFSGGGGDVSAQAGPAVLSNTSGVVGFTIQNGGTGSSTSTTITLTGGGGTGAQGVVTGLSGGSITQISVVAPGSGYTSNPTVAAGAGSGLQATALIGGGQIASIPVTNGGSGYNSPPQVIIDPPNSDALPTLQAIAHATIAGGVVTGIVIDNPGIGYDPSSPINVRLVGGNSSASAEVHIMPFGMYGNAIETYQGSVFIADKNKVSFSAPSSTSNFAASDGGGGFTASDNFLRWKIVALKQSTGFLYLIADSSTNVLSNLQTTASGTDVTTSIQTSTYSNANIDPQIGCAWRDTAISFGRALMFANSTGIYAMYGGAAQKVSQPLDNLFAQADWTNPPTAAACVMFSIPIYVFSFNTIDPYLQARRTVMAAWDGQKWFVVSQLKVQRFVSTQEINSDLTAWATDGTNVYPMFQVPSTALTKTFQTKLRTAPSHIISKQVNAMYVTAEANSGASNYINIGIDTEKVNGPLNTITLEGFLVFVGTSPITFVGTSPITFETTGLIAAKYSLAKLKQSVYGRYIGFTAQTTAEDLTLLMLSVLFADFSPIAP